MINRSNGVKLATAWKVIQVILNRKSSVIGWFSSAIFKGNSVSVQKSLRGREAFKRKPAS